MPTYRCYFFNDQHIRVRRDINAPNDGEAIVAAARLLNGVSAEIWRGTLMIGTVKPVREKRPSEILANLR